MTSPELDPEQQNALNIARALAAAGIPIFVAARDPEGVGHSGTGFWLPTAWEQTKPDPAVVDLWKPGMALCAVMGQGLDLLDVDPRNDGGISMAALNGVTPTSYGVAFTPSGGMHSFIKPLSVGSRDNVYPGIDVKGGMPDGSGRGFAFLAPTIKPSKVTGELVAYRWEMPPNLEGLHGAKGANDVSGENLAARIRELKADSGSVPKNTGTNGAPQWFTDKMRRREPQSWLAADKAIAEKLDEVATWTAEVGRGFRLTLERAGMTLGGYVGGGYLPEDDARDQLETAVSKVWGTPDQDDLLWITQGLTDGAERPFVVYTAEDELRSQQIQANGASEGSEGGFGGNGGQPPWNVYTAIGAYPFDPQFDDTDQGLAEAVVYRMYPTLRYGVDSGTWLVRSGQVWREREDMAGWAISQLARLMPLGSSDFPKNKDEWTDAHYQAKRRSRFMTSGPAGGIERKLKAVVKDADRPGGIEVSKLDTDPEVLWAGGMAWNLRASTEYPLLADIDPATPHLRSALCAPELRPTPAWDAFVATVFPDPEVRAWALRVLSITLAGYPDAAVPVLYGPERTGKTALVSLLVRVLGSYGHAADPRLLAGADNAHASVVYALKGRRLSFIDEGPRRGHLASERLKQLTGGGQLTGNAMRANPVTFDPTHTLVMTTNDEPPITDPALRARMRIIPCEADRDLVRATRQALNPAWRREAPGVLAKMMMECAAWLNDPNSALTEAAPLGIRGAAEDMLKGQDPIAEWIENCTVPSAEGTSGRALHRAFATWHEGQPVYRKSPCPSETAFGRALTRLDYKVMPGCGPNRDLKYRPLAILGGGGYGLGWPQPTLAPDGVRTVPEGSSEQLSEADNASSSPIFSSSSDSPDSTSTIIYKEETHNTHIYRGDGAPAQTNGGKGGPTETSRNDLEKAGVTSAFDPPDEPSGAVEPSGNSPVLASKPLKTSFDLRKYPFPGKPLPDDYSPQSNLTAYQVTVWAEARNIDKAQARAELKTIKAEAKAQEKLDLKHAKLQSAEGAKVNLPAGCDRTGDVRALTLDQAAAAVRACLSRTPALTVDVETAGYPLGHEHYRLRTVQLGDDQLAVTFDPHQSDQAELIKQLLSEAPALHAHSATADLAPLADASLIDYQAGWDRMFDTGIVALLNDPKSTGSDPGLKQLASSVLGPLATAPAADKARGELFAAGGWLKETDVTTPLERSGWAQVDSEATTMVRYAASDVLDTAAIAKRLPGVPEALLSRERAVQRQTAPLALIGVRLDYEHVQEMRSIHEPLREQSKARALAMAGGDIDNPGSPTQVAKKLTAMGVQLPLTKPNRKTGAGGGQPSADKAALEPLQHLDGPVGDLVTEVLDYRHNNTLINMFLVPFSLLCEKGDGRARPTVYTLGTDTGRMSVVRPNLQQLSRQGGIRACITADPGQLMVGADFSGIELRVAAALSQDPNLIRILAEGRDIHAEIALQVWGADQELSAKAGKPTPKKEHRYKAKPMVFGRIYGGGAATLAGQTGTTLQEANAVIETLDALAPGLAAWSTQMRNWVKGGGTQFPTYAGRIIYMDPDQPHKAGNYAIQGSARELLVDSMLKWADTRWGGAVLLPVHDELDAFVPEGEAVEATAALVSCMETELYGVKIIAEPSEPSFYWQDSS